MIRLHASHVREIQGHGEACYPRECCGVLVGTVEKGVTHVAEVCAVRNARSGAAYLIDPEALLPIERAARRRGLDVVGYYHSHPDAPARPSSEDCRHAWAHASYVIVSVSARRAGEVTAWIARALEGPLVEQPIERDG